ncbi:MAG: DeoR/GlpR family transcriptional regulator [Anaerolineae bacterium]|nr:DeoR/GlpR family transcriptional regulator [Anaerolineae bacterium]
MNKKQLRQKAIIDLMQSLTGEQLLKTTEIAEQLDVSEMTIRRDLQELEAAGQIERQHGGVIIPQPDAPLPTLYRVGILLVSRDMKFSDPFFNEVIEGLDCKLHDLRCHIQYIRTSADVETIEQSRLLLTTDPVDGIITIGVKRSASITYLQQNAPKLVTIIDSLGEKHDTILFDGAGGIQKIVDHLYRLGKRRLGFVTGYYDDREQGFIDAIARLELDDDPALRVTITYDQPKGWSPVVGEEAAEKLLNLSHPPEAIVCASDRLAIGVMQRLHQYGLRVPDDIAVTGVDNISDAAYTIPPLTTVHVHKKLIGALAAERLVRQMENPDEVPLQICAPTHLVIRESCGSQLNRGGQAGTT